jgi:PAS domain S-box-containing protein
MQSAAGPADLVGLVQSHGVVLVVRVPEARIVQVSSHAGAWLGQPLEEVLLGPVERLGGDLGGQLRELASRDDPAAAAAPPVLACTIGPPGATRSVEAWVHRVGPDLLTVDLLDQPLLQASGEPDDARPDAAELLEHLEDTIHALSQANTIEELSSQAVRRLQALCGHEEVRIVRFGADGGTHLVATRRESDGPLQPARTWPAELHALPGGFPGHAPGGVDVLVDAWQEPVLLLPHHLPGSTGPAIAARVVSGSTLRCPEPARLARLREAGVRAESRAALYRDGKPWGVIACLDSRSPRALPAPCRYAFGLLVEAVATRITAIESAGRAEVAEQVRRLQDLLVDATTQEGDWRAALQRKSYLLLGPLQASGAALLHDGDILACGDVPQAPDLRAIAACIDARGSASVWCSDELAAEDPALAGRVAPGTRLLAARLSVRQPDYLLWFRQAGEVPATAWSNTDHARAASFAEMLVDLMVQADAVRLLITDRQLARLHAKVSHSREAVVVCDAQGQVTLANVAFGELAGLAPAQCRTLDDFLALFTPAVVARRLAGQVRAEQRSARSVLALPRPDGTVLPVAVRAEPVLARSGGLLGMIILVEDLTAARLAEAAWTQLQGLLGSASGHGASHEPDPVVSALHTHASLAAMDMADTTRTPGLAPLLQEVESATQRAIALYRRLSARLRRGGPPG